MAERLQIKFAGETVYDNKNENLLVVYMDLWKSRIERDQMIEYSVAGENLRKLISKDDSGTTSGSTGKVGDEVMFDTHGTKQKAR